ncbi:hypothetical protein [Geitlerinema sp. PCC 7407]|nr:hypothetical protein [Geitlerinema sp. PCC 7407]
MLADIRGDRPLAIRGERPKSNHPRGDRAIAPGMAAVSSELLRCATPRN